MPPEFRTRRLFLRIAHTDDADNARCRRVADECGYRMEKTERQTDRSPDGQPRDRCIYVAAAAAGAQRVIP